MAAYAYPLLIKQLLVTPIAQRSRKEIVYRDRRRYGYPVLIERIARLGSVLARLRVGSGSTVAILDWDSHRYLECYFAIPMSGATLMKVNFWLAPDQVAYCLEHAQADTVLLHTDFVPLVEQIRRRLPRVKRFICLRDDGQVQEGFDWAGEYESLLATGDPEHSFPDFDENTRATLYYTAATTGAPKGVAFSHRQVVLHCLTLLASMSQVGGGAVGGRAGTFSRNEIYLPLTPMLHAHAWGFPYIATLCGWQQIYPGAYDPSSLRKLITDEGVTFSHCVPTTLKMVLSAPGAHGLDFRGWKVLIVGHTLSRELWRLARARNIDVYSSYGLAESGSLLTLARITPDALEDGKGGPASQGAEASGQSELDLLPTAGMPLLLAQMRLVPDDRTAVPPDRPTVGEVVVRAPYLTQGYLKRPEASADLWQGEWMHTGDLGRFDAQGHLTFIDRQEDVIKRADEWISSIAVENVISQHPGVREVAVIGAVGTGTDARVLAVVVARDESNLDAEQLHEHMRAQAAAGAVSATAVPDRYVFVDELAKTSVGKLDKKRLRQLYAQQPSPSS